MSILLCRRTLQLDKEVSLRTLAAQNAQRKRKMGDIKEVIEQVSPQHSNVF